jgi:hypothetical protein
MPEGPQDQSFQFDLGEYGGEIRFASLDELQSWNQNELNAWRWLVGETVSPWLRTVFGIHEGFYREVNGVFNQWQSYRQETNGATRAGNLLLKVFEKYYLRGQIFHNSNPAAHFVFQLKEKRGDIVAGGAYVSLVNSRFDAQAPYPAGLFEGVVEASLYRRGVDWTASAHLEALNILRAEYTTNLDQQRIRAAEIETENGKLNAQFAESLNTKATALTVLHTNRSKEFDELVVASNKRLADLEKAYDAAWAIQKPVTYWEDKERQHRNKARIFAAVVALAFLSVTGLLIDLIYKILGPLKPDESPKHWQIGVFVAVAFLLYGVHGFLCDCF